MSKPPYEELLVYKIWLILFWGQFLVLERESFVLIFSLSTSSQISIFFQVPNVTISVLCNLIPYIFAFSANFLHLPIKVCVGCIVKPCYLILLLHNMLRFLIRFSIVHSKWYEQISPNKIWQYTQGTPPLIYCFFLWTLN